VQRPLRAGDMPAMVPQPEHQKSGGCRCSHGTWIDGFNTYLLCGWVGNGATVLSLGRLRPASVFKHIGVEPAEFCLP